MGSGRDCVSGSDLDHLFIVRKKHRECGLQITSGLVLSPNVYLGLFPLDVDSVDFCLMGHRLHFMLRTFTYIYIERERQNFDIY